MNKKKVISQILVFVVLFVIIIIAVLIQNNNIHTETNSSEYTNLNDSSIVIELDYENTKYLFMGDATTRVEEMVEWNEVQRLI